MNKSVIVRMFNNHVVSSQLMIGHPENAEYIVSHNAGYDIFLSPLSDTKDIAAVTSCESFQQFLASVEQTMKFVEKMAEKYG